MTLYPPQSYTQKGRRPYQEDARYPDTDSPAADRRPFFLVCDGVGGQDKGEVASHTLCQAFARLLESPAGPGAPAQCAGEQQLAGEQQPAGEQQRLPSDAAQFQRLFEQAYSQFSQVARRECTTMATTLTFICFTPDGYTAAHCGDSRIYHIRPARGIIYRSQDHSLVGEMLRNGVISEAEAAHHPQSNIITRCVMLPTDGPADRLPRVTVHQSSDIQPGDYFLLCTDGVVHQATDPFLVSLLSDTTLTDTEKIAQLARQTRDSSDNNTACLLHIADTDGLRPHTAPAATTSDTSDTPGGQPTPLGPKPTGSTAPSPQSDTRPLKPQGHTATLLEKIKGLFG